MPPKIPLIIALVGKRASGKDVCARYLVRKYKAKVFAMSNFIAQVLDLFHVPANRKNIVWLISRARRQFGPGILAKAVADAIKNCDNSLVIINGIRLLDEAKILKKQFSHKFILAKVISSDYDRWQRVITRENKNYIPKDEVKSSLRDFLQQEKRIITEKEIPALEKKARWEVKNFGKRKEVYGQIDRMMKRVRKITG